MEIPLHKDLNYSRQIQEIPQSFKKQVEIIAPVSGQKFETGGFIDFYLPTNYFLKQKTLTFKYNYALTSAVSAECIGTPAYTVINRVQISCGSFSEIIPNYNVIMNMKTNTQMDVAMKYGNQHMYGYNNNTVQPTFEFLMVVFVF